MASQPPYWGGGGGGGDNKGPRNTIILLTFHPQQTLNSDSGRFPILAYINVVNNDAYISGRFLIHMVWYD